ncbi:MAG TPA: hypothetical protein VEH07_03335 [Alphaproteobacteria bacterium]|nr:hypothetical protein [Alphaproteobacteria bacterium]
MATNSEVGIGNPRACGSCTLCCKIYELPILEKAAGAWCQHCTPGKGCSIHSARPSPCRTFQCVWTVAAALDNKWRPDNAGFVIAAVDMQLFVDVDPEKPDAWRKEPYYSQFKRWSSRNQPRFLTVVIRSPKQSIVVFPETEIALGPPRSGVEIRSGYQMQNGKLVPYAHFEEQPS